MMMIPIHVIAFFLATLLLPADVSQFSINVHGETIQWTRQEIGWSAVELPSDDFGTYTVSSNVVIVAGEGKEWKTDMTKFITLPADSIMTTIKEIPTASKSLGTPVLIKRDKNIITLSQEKGSLFETPVIITWQTSKIK
jgi:acetoacetate decarboxylase